MVECPCAKARSSPEYVLPSWLRHVPPKAGSHFNYTNYYGSSQQDEGAGNIESGNHHRWQCGWLGFLARTSMHEVCYMRI